MRQPKCTIIGCRRRRDPDAIRWCGRHSLVWLNSRECDVISEIHGLEMPGLRARAKRLLLNDMAIAVYDAFERRLARPRESQRRAA